MNAINSMTQLGGCSKAVLGLVGYQELGGYLGTYPIIREGG